MIAPTPEEQAALQACLPHLAEAMAEIGWTTRLNELTEAQALTLVEVTIGAFQDTLHDRAASPALEVSF